MMDILTTFNYYKTKIKIDKIYLKDNCVCVVFSFGEDIYNRYYTNIKKEQINEDFLLLDIINVKCFSNLKI